MGSKVKCLAVVLAGSLMAAGCAEDENKPKTVKLPGTIESIDLNGRTVRVHGYSEKHSQSITETIEVTDDTEIMINGAIAKLSDVRVGERAEGVIKIVKQNNQRRLIAVSVEIERDETLVAPDKDEGGEDQG